MHLVVSRNTLFGVITDQPMQQPKRSLYPHFDLLCTEYMQPILHCKGFFENFIRLIKRGLLDVIQLFY